MRRAEGERRRKEAELVADVEEMNKMSKRTMRVTREHAMECKRLLTLMGGALLLLLGVCFSSCHSFP